MADLERDLANMREYFGRGKTKTASWRKSQLKGLLTFLKEREEDIFQALKQDLGKHHVEAFRDEVCMPFFRFSTENLYIFCLQSNIRLN